MTSQPLKGLGGSVTAIASLCLSVAPFGLNEYIPERLLLVLHLNLSVRALRLLWRLHANGHDVAACS